MLVPYGKYSLREVFDKFGAQVFKGLWAGNEAEFFAEVLKLSPDEHTYNPYKMIIYPLTSDYFLEHTEDFLIKSYDEIALNDKLELFLKAHYESYHTSRNEESMRLKRRQASSSYPTSIIVPPELGLNGESDSRKTIKIELIRHGIKFWAVAIGIRRILNNGDLKASIIDEKTGNCFELENKYWLAENSKYSFATGKGSHKKYYSYPYKWNDKEYFSTGNTEYNGYIVFDKKACDEVIERLFAPKEEKLIKANNKGRKPKEVWDEFAVEVFRRLKNLENNELPKQDSFAQTMKEWCDKRSDKPVGLSTIKAKLKSYYDIIKSENSE